MSTTPENPTTGAASSSEGPTEVTKATDATKVTEATVATKVTKATEATEATERIVPSVSPEANRSTGGSSPSEAAASIPPLPPAPTYFPTATAAATAALSVTPGRPHVRWGGVVWGALLVAIAGFVLFTVSSRARQSAFETWVAGLTPGVGWTLAVVAVGVFILILALLAVVRSAQRNRRA
jgi:hypothetical protein